MKQFNCFTKSLLTLTQNVRSCNLSNRNLNRKKEGNDFNYSNRKLKSKGQKRRNRTIILPHSLFGLPYSLMVYLIEHSYLCCSESVKKGKMNEYFTRNLSVFIFENQRIEKEKGFIIKPFPLSLSQSSLVRYRPSRYLNQLD